MKIKNNFDIIIDTLKFNHIVIQEDYIMLTNMIKIEIEGKTKIVKEETMVKDLLYDDNRRD